MWDNLVNVPPPPTKKFWDLAKNEPIWWEKIGKVVNWVKLAIPSQYELLFGGKPGKSWKLTKIGHFEPIRATLVAKLAIVGHFEPLQLEMIQKVANLGKLSWCNPPRQNWQKLKYLSRISTDLYEIFITGCIFQASRNEPKKCYAMIKTDKT